MTLRTSFKGGRVQHSSMRTSQSEFKPKWKLFIQDHRCLTSTAVDHKSVCCTRSRQNSSWFQSQWICNSLGSLSMSLAVSDPFRIRKNWSWQVVQARRACPYPKPARAQSQRGWNSASFSRTAHFRRLNCRSEFHFRSPFNWTKQNSSAWSAAPSPGTYSLHWDCECYWD